MPSGINTQTTRNARYEQRCQNKKVDQQNIQRTIRAQTRGLMMPEISKEVSKEICSTANKKRMSTRLRTPTTFFFEKS